MPSNFSESGKCMQAAIPVPELPVASIRNRLRAANARNHSRVRIACALAAITALGSGSVLAAMKYGGVRIWLSGDKAAVAMNSFAYLQNPNAADLRRLTSDATFAVVLPVGIPKGMHMNSLLFSPADHPNFIEVRYRNAKTDGRSGQFLLFDSSIVNHGDAPTLPNGKKLPLGQVAHWSIGQETVIVAGAGRGAETKAAMSGTTPAESMAQTLPLLYRITVLADQDKLADAAQAIAPSEGRSVLLDRDYLSEIASLAQLHKPLVFVRGTMFDTYPMIGGKPDFGHAKRHSTTETAVSTNGVRAIAAVLASNVCGTGARRARDFTCEMLINERSGRAYSVWVLPLNASTPPAKYLVDSRTFRLRRG